MTALTQKQRAKVNAALCMIHDHGGDASAITAKVRTMIASGHDARTAYEKALNGFADSNPELGHAIGKITRLVEASDDGTVARYDTALSSYIATGDNTGLKALAPTIAQDSIALAVREGELTPDEAANGDLGKALGFDPGDELKEALASPARSQPQPKATFAFDTRPTPQTLGGRPMVGRAPDGSAIVRTSSQISISQSVTGMVASEAARQLAERGTFQGWAPTSAPASATNAAEDA